MNEEQLKEFLESFKTEIKSELEGVLSTVDKKNQGLASSLSKEFKKSLESVVKEPELEKEPEKESNKERLNLSTLQKQIQSLREEVAEKDNNLAIKTRDGQILSAFSSNKVTHADKALKAFLVDQGDKLKREGDEWYVVNGDEVKTVDSGVKEFLDTDFGSYFLPPTKGLGTGDKRSNTSTNVKEKSELTLNEALFSPMEE